MVTAAAYILKVPEERRKVLLANHTSWYRPYETHVAEPVPWFDHSRRAPLVVLASFEDGFVTHIADGRKGASAGTGLVRLNMESIEELETPVAFSALVTRVPIRVRNHLDRRLQTGGKLPPKTLSAVVDALVDAAPSLASRLARFSERRANQIRSLSENSRFNLALQKETLATALAITGLDSEGVLSWNPASSPESERSFLDGLPQAYIREDAAIISDFSDIPGFAAIRSSDFASRVFTNESNPSIRLTVVMANRLPLEQQTGADLIYFNETYRSFVMVQYKSMERANDGYEFRWQEGDQLSDEINRMDNLMKELGAVAADKSVGGFRLHATPF